MKAALSPFESVTDSLMKMAAAGLKFSIALGSACVILYCIRIGHFPQGLALGDGLLFLLAAGCFGFLYAFFTASLIGLGSCLSPLTNQVLKFFSWATTRIRRKNIKPLYEIEPFKWSSTPFAALSIVMIIVLGGNDYSVYVKLSAVAVMLHMLYSVAIEANKELRTAQSLQDSIIDIPDRGKAAAQASKHKKLITLLLF